MRFTARASVALLLLLASATMVPAADDGALWSRAFAPPGVASPVFAFAELDGALIAGDERWTGAGWERLGDGLDGQVNALTIFEGSLIAGGYFRASGVVAAAARWNGATWEPLGSLRSNVSSLAVYQGQIYAGVDGALFRWDGASWTQVLQTAGGEYDGRVEALQIYNGLLVAGGTFTTVGAVAAPGVVGWNGEAIVSLGAPYGAGWYGSATHGLAVHNGRLCAAGEYYIAGQYTAAVVSWDGTDWTSLYANDRKHLRCIASSGGRLYAAGASYVGLGLPWAGLPPIWWDGTSWHNTENGCTGYVNALFSCAAGLAVGGSFGSFGTSAVSPNAALWDGSAFLPLVGGGQGVCGDVKLLAVEGSHLLVAGDFIVAGNATTPSYGRWDGTAWSSCYSSLDSSPAAVCSAGGTTLLSGYYQWWPGGYCLRLDQCEPVDSYGPVFSSMVFQAGTFYGCGNDYSGGTVVSEVDRLDGSTWTSVGRTGTGTIVCATPTSAGLAVGGDFGAIGGVAAQGIARWDGTAWQTLGSGLAGTVTALAEHAGAVCAGGSIAPAGGAPRQQVMRWDGAAWQPLGDPFDGSINCLASCYGDLYAAGSFLHAGAIPAARIAKWDGTAWQPLGTGLDGDVLALQPFQDALYIGGRFHHAGGRPSFHIAAWSASVVGVELQDFVAIRSGAGVTVSWRMPGAAPGDVYRLLRGGPTDSPVPIGSWNTSVSEDYAVADPQAPATACDYWLEYVGGYVEVRRYGPAHLDAAPPPALVLALHANVPNPFNPSTTFAFTIPRAASVRLSIYDVRGRLIARPLDAVLPAGDHSAKWDGRDRSGAEAPSGSYLAQVETPQGIRARKVQLVR